MGSATVACTAYVQTTGDQRRRVLGELQGGAQDTWPTVTFTLSDLGPLQTLEIKEADARGAAATRSIQYVEGKGRLTFAGKAVEVPVRCLLRYATTMPDAGKPGIGIEAYFTVKGRELGLVRLANDDIDVRVGMRGTLTRSDAPVPAD